jgi:hypothetical protein
MGTEQRLFIGLPIYGSIDPNFFRATLQFCQDAKIPCQIGDLCGDSAIGRARNSITKQFLNSDCTDLLFIDTDLVYSSEHIQRIITHDVDVIGGLYPKKDPRSLQWVLNTMDTYAPPLPQGIQEVKYVGTGFMRIRRGVFEKMLQSFGREIHYTSDHDHKTTEWDFWHMGVYEYPDGHRRFLSEDWWFCQMWRDLGGKVFVDNHIILRHSGSAVFPLPHQEEVIFGKREVGPSVAAVGGDTAIPTASPPAEFKREVIPRMEPARA